MPEVHATITADKKPELVALIRKLPAILAGGAPDYHNLAEGFKSRLGFALLSLIAPNFEDLSRGMTGADGTKWPPLTKEYLAYQRRFGPTEKSDLKKMYALGRGHRFAPGTSKGLLTKEQLKVWRQTYARQLARFVMKMTDEEAKARAAAIAWIVVKKMGAKTKLEVYGNRVVQILVDEGRLRGSLQPGSLVESGPKAVYSKPSGVGGSEQLFETQELGRFIVGSDDKKATWHHNAKKPNRRRRLWPENLPGEWWRQILGQAVAGLTKLAELFPPGV